MMFGAPERGPAKFLWWLIGVVALTLGGIGVVMPLLPTTPLVILAAFAFGKGSPELAIWIVDSRTFGPIIAQWRRNRAIAPRHKLVASAAMAAVLIMSLLAGVSTPILGVQAIFIAGAAGFVLSRPNGPS